MLTGENSVVVEIVVSWLFISEAFGSSFEFGSTISGTTSHRRAQASHPPQTFSARNCSKHSSGMCSHGSYGWKYQLTKINEKREPIKNLILKLTDTPLTKKSSLHGWRGVWTPFWSAHLFSVMNTFQTFTIWTLT